MAVKEGLIKGDLAGGHKIFAAARPVTRTEFALLLTRALKLRGAVTPEPPFFTDAAQIPAWARNDLAVALGVGLIRGYPDGAFRARAPVKRAEAAVMVAPACWGYSKSGIKVH